MQNSPPAFTDRFRAGVALAQAVHGGQRRPGTGIPYLAHLLVVTGLVVEDGGDEDQAIAAMLHDAVEDGGGRGMLETIARAFGPRVSEIVAGCSDTVDGRPAEPWVERKRRYLDHLQTIDDEGVLRVALADKVHNAGSIVRAYRQGGHGLWARFGDRSAGEEVWYYRGLLELFERRRPGPLTEDLRHAVAELAWLVACDPGAEVASRFAPTLRPPPTPATRGHGPDLRRDAADGTGARARGEISGGKRAVWAGTFPHPEGRGADRRRGGADPGAIGPPRPP
jgi:HD domain